MRGWVELLTVMTKKYGEEYEMGQKDRRRNTGEPKWKRKKQGRIFGLLKIGNLIQMVFYLKILQTYASGILFCSSHRIE
jgi:hypothetical protein